MQEERPNSPISRQSLDGVEKTDEPADYPQDESAARITVLLHRPDGERVDTVAYLHMHDGRRPQ